MKGIIVGPRGCGKTRLIIDKLYRPGDIVIDPFNEHSANFTGILPRVGVNNIFNLKEVPVNKLRETIEKFLQEINGNFDGTVFIDSVDCVQPNNHYWLEPYFNTFEYESLNIMLVLQDIKRCEPFMFDADVFVGYRRGAPKKADYLPDYVSIKDDAALTKQHPILLKLYE